jgi:hypothetical protein
MYCPQCGVGAEEHYRYCSKCGAELSGVAKEIAPATAKNMATHIKVIGWLFMVSGVLSGIFGAVVIVFGRLIPSFQLERFPEFREIPFDFSRLASVAVVGVGFFTIAIAIGTFMAGYGLLQYKPWARIVAIVVAILGLTSFPLGTALGIYALWALLSEPGRNFYLSKAAIANPI